MKNIMQKITGLLVGVLATALLAACNLPIDQISQILDQGQSVDLNNPETGENVQGIEKDDTAGALEAVPVTGISETRYVYETLSDEEKTVYNQVLDCILNQNDRIGVSTLDESVLDRAFLAVNADYGGLFWVDGYVYTTYTENDVITALEFAPKYTMTYDERNTMQTSIDVVVDQMLSGISISDSDYDKAKYVFCTLINNVDYDLEAAENQNIISAFIYKSTVCQGYACATQYLLNQLGIQCFIVTGTANGESHAWNVVQLDGDYYYMDTTWGNSTFSSEGDMQQKFINYSYLNVTTDEINRTHTANGNITLPECSAMADNYFVREGLYFENWDPDAIGALYNASWNGDRSSVSVRFSQAELYEQAKKYYIDDQHISDYCSGITSISYLEDSSQNVLTLSF